MVLAIVTKKGRTHMSLAFFKSPRQIIFIIFGLEYKKSKYSDADALFALRTICITDALPVLPYRLRILFHCHYF